MRYNGISKAIIQAVFSDLIEKYSLILYDGPYGASLKNDNVVLDFYYEDFEGVILWVTIDKTLKMSFQILMQHIYGNSFSEDWDNKIEAIISDNFSSSERMYLRNLYQYKFLINKYMQHILDGTDFTFLPKLKSEYSTFSKLLTIMVNNKLNTSALSGKTIKYGSEKKFPELIDIAKNRLMQQGIELPEDINKI